MRPGVDTPKPMTEKRSIPPPTEPTEGTPTFLDRHEPSAALALFAVGVQLRYNLRTQRAELVQLADDAIPVRRCIGGST